MATTLKCATKYKARGWSVIPVPIGKKEPSLPGWQKLQIKENELRDHFSGKINIGVLLGESSSWLVDIDLDCPEARKLASYFLPPTGLIFGRPTRKPSHLEYISPGLKSKRFTDVDRKILLEIRSTGSQTIFPPSIYPNGEKSSWKCNGKPAEVRGEELQHKAARLAASALVKRHWPKKGSRQEAALALAGYFLQCGLSKKETESFIKHVAIAAKDEEWGKRVSGVADTARRIDEGREITGRKKLAELLQKDGERVVEKLDEWLFSDGPGGTERKLSSDRIPLVSSHDLAKLAAENPVEWLVDGLIPAGSVVVLNGYPGSYKSYLALLLSYSIARGKPFLGRQTIKGPVVHIDKENPMGVLPERVRQVGYSKNFRLWPLWQVPESPPLFDGRYDRIAAGIRLLTFDSLRKFHDRNENNPHEMVGIMSRIRSLTRSGATVLILHHPAKAEGSTYRGTTEILAGVDISMLLELQNKGRHEGGPVPLTLRIIKHRYVPEHTLSLEFLSEENGFTFRDVTKIREEERKDEKWREMKKVQRIIRELRKPNQSELLKKIRTDLGKGKNKALEVLKNGEGQYWKSKAKRGARVYFALSSVS